MSDQETEDPYFDPDDPGPFAGIQPRKIALIQPRPGVEGQWEMHRQYNVHPYTWGPPCQLVEGEQLEKGEYYVKIKAKDLVQFCKRFNG